MKTLLDRDLLSALVLVGIGGLFWSRLGNDPVDWIMPRLAIYVVFFMAAGLLAKFLYGVATGHLPDIVHIAQEDRIAARDLVTYAVIVFVFLVALQGLGFWLASLLMLMAASISFTVEKTRRNIALALVVPLATCVAGYFVFEHVFYVPVPESAWFSGLF